MPSEWYDLIYVGLNRAFVVSFDRDSSKEIELTKEQLNKVSLFEAKQQARLQEFLKELLK